MSVILQNIPGTNASNNHTSYFGNTIGCANGIGCIGLNVCGQKGGNKKKRTRKKHCSRKVKRFSKGGVNDLCRLLHNPDSNIVILPGKAHKYCKKIMGPNYMCATNGECMTIDDIRRLASERPDIIGGNKKKRTRKSKTRKTRKRKTRERKTRERKTRKTRKTRKH